MEKTPKMLETEKRFGKDLEKILKEFYVDKRIGTVEIGEKFGMNPSTVAKWLRKYDINIRTLSEAKLPPNSAKPSKPELEKAYLIDKKSTAHIAGEHGVSSVTISRWLREYCIPARTCNEATLRASFVKPTKEQLKEWYANQKMHSYDIARRICVNPSTVRRWLCGYDLPVRTNSEIQLPAGVVRPSMAQLNEWYIVEGQTTVDIGKKLGISSSTVGSWLRDYGIRLRNKSEARLPHGFVKPAKEQLKEWYIDKQMSTIDISKKLGVGNVAIARWLRNYNISARHSHHACSKSNISDIKELLKSYVGEKKYAS